METAKILKRQIDELHVGGLINFPIERALLSIESQKSLSMDVHGHFRLAGLMLGGNTRFVGPESKRSAASSSFRSSMSLCCSRK